MSSKEVDEFVKSKVLPQHQGIVEKLRSLMKQNAPSSDEIISRGSPAWKANGNLAIISISKTHITFAFTRGAEFKDTHGLLDGIGKTTRHVKIKTLETLNEPALRDYIKQAVKLDEE
jgi:hypothetical protein